MLFYMRNFSSTFHTFALRYIQLAMKTVNPVAFLILLTCLLFHLNASAQITARRLTKRVTDANAANQANQSAPASPAPAQTIVPVPASQPRILTNAVPEKTKEQKEEMLRKTIEFQKKRAETGAPTAQYDLGMRYLNGDGVEKNSELAEKWLRASATNGNSQAAKKLEELNKK
jgi:TPR repeat protein